MKKLLITALFLFPTLSFASTFPKFPMAFYGVASINGSVAPTGTVIRAYYGNTLAGQSTTDSTGAYGYASSTAQKLLVNEGTGNLTFTFQTPTLLSGQENTGSTTNQYAGFEEGSSTSNNLYFTYTVPNTKSGGGSSGGGGGGGSSGGGGGGSSGGGSSGGGGVVLGASTSTATSTVQTNVSTCKAGEIFNTTTGVRCTQATVVPSNSPISIVMVSNIQGSLSVGSKGANVKNLQIFLNSQGMVVAKTGAGSPGNETTSFGPATKSALIKWQKKFGIKPASGTFGPLTKAKIKSMGF
jgi:hypothetical protein